MRCSASLWLFVLGTVVASPACKEKKKDPEVAETSGERAQAPTIPARIAPFSGDLLGGQRGYIEGGMLYGAARVDEVQTFAQSLPLPPRVARDIAEVGSLLGLDLRVDDLRKRFGLADDAIISMTFGRPLGGDQLSGLETDLERGGAFLGALNYEPPKEAADPPRVDISYAIPREPPPKVVSPPAAARPIQKLPTTESEAPPVAPPPGGTLEPEPEPEPEPLPPPPTVEAIAKAEEFRAQASRLGLQLRIHVPAPDPTQVASDLAALVPRRDSSRWESLCGAIPGATRCFGESDVVVMLRPGKTGLDIDVVFFLVSQKSDERSQILAAREAVAAEPVERRELSQLRGDAALYLDVAGIRELGRAEAVSRSVRALDWTSEDDRRSVLDRNAERVQALEQLMDAKVLFDGVWVEANADADQIRAHMQWHGVPAHAGLAAELLSGPELGADVPTLAALCDGSLACARTRGLPQPATLRDQLATGIYAERQRDLERVLNRGDEWAAMLGFAATWPNLLGAVAHWPAQEIGRGPEAAIANNVVDAIGRIEGFGMSIRSLSFSGRRFTSDYAAYSRLRRGEVDLVRTGLTFTEAPISDVTLSNELGKATSVRIPEDEIPATIMLYKDPAPDEDTPAEFGWASVVDGPDRMSWLLGLPREANAGPSAYAEIPNLWQLFTAFPDVDRDLGFARAWLDGREFRVAATVSGGAPQIDALLRRRPE